MFNFDELTFDELQVLEALYEVYDPEIGINVVDLGLIRSLELRENTLLLNMTLTSPACPLSEELEEEISHALKDRNLVSDVVLEWEFIPPWALDDVSPDGRSQLKAMGF